MRGAVAGAVALMVALAAAHVSTAAASPRPLFGFNDSAVSFEEHPDRAAGEAEVARLPVSWEVTEPAPNDFDWSQTDGAVRALNARGVRVLFVISAAPRWAAPDCVTNYFVATCGVGRGYEWAYQRLALELLDRYPGSRIQAWNEPNIDPFGALHPTRAAELTNSLYAVAPHAVIGPAASPGDKRHLPYTRRMYRHINRHVPLGVNFYPRSVVNHRGIGIDWRDVQKIAGERPIWVTEIGFSSDQFGLAGQAAKAAQAYGYLADRGARAIIFHRLVDVPVAGSPWLSSLGMLDSDGEPKPAFRALRRAVRD
jgi:hypothetical protein